VLQKTFNARQLEEKAEEGYILLGMIIERASSQSFADFLKSNIFGPLDMTN
jgi:CubicO group peptidase (beta-lactamase class C family)